MTNEQRERLAAAVRDGLRRTGLSQKELARKSGTSAGQLCNALNGVSNMSPTKWEMCCEALGLDYQQLMAEETKEQIEPEQETVEAYGQTYRRIDTEWKEAEELRTRLQAVQEALAAANAKLEKVRQENHQLKHQASEAVDLLVKERDALFTERDQLKHQLEQQMEKTTELIGDNQRLTEVAAHFEELYNVVDAQLKAEVEQRNKREQAEREQAAQFEEAGSYYARQLEKLKLALFDKEHPELA